MQVVTLGQLQRPLTVVYELNAFPMLEPSGVYLREFSTAELAGWREQCRSFDAAGELTLDTDKLTGLELYHCVLTGPDADSPRLFAGAGQRPEGAPESYQLIADLEFIAQRVPPGVLARLVSIIDALSGFPTGMEAHVKSLLAAGRASGSGASTGSDGSQRKSTSATVESGRSSATT